MYTNPLTTIRTDRLVLRKYEKKDAEFVLRLVLTNSERLKEAGVITDEVYKMKTVEEASLFIDKMIAGWLLKKFFVFGIWEKESNILIGEYKIFNINWGIKSAETGGFLDYRHEGKLFYLECGRNMRQYVFELLQFNEMIVSCKKDNLVSQFSISRSKIFKKFKENESMLFFSVTKEEYFEYIKKKDTLQNDIFI